MLSNYSFPIHYRAVSEQMALNVLTSLMEQGIWFAYDPVNIGRVRYLIVHEMYKDDLDKQIAEMRKDPALDPPDPADQPESDWRPDVVLKKQLDMVKIDKFEEGAYYVSQRQLVVVVNSLIKRTSQLKQELERVKSARNSSVLQ